NPAFGRVICRCQTITEGEILEAIRSPIPPVSIDAIKRRTGAGLGRCQGGFCGPRVLEILSRELGVDPAEILQDKDGSYIVLGDNRPEVRI
ncbi:MAG: FAD/NAD(P)-binding oxidoreductase, partial [Clostridia bacterium]|nr:FAD/NAD(P)-binding oxidoreductase [Clostridia bacterium]